MQTTEEDQAINFVKNYRSGELQKTIKSHMSDARLRTLDIHNAFVTNSFKTKYQAASNHFGPRPIIHHMNMAYDLEPVLPASKYAMSLKELKEVNLRALKYKRNENTYLEGEIVHEPFGMSSAFSPVAYSLVKDSVGRVVMVVIGNILKELDLKQVTEMFAVGRKIIFLHPYYKMLDDGETVIRVDNRWEYFFKDEAETPVNLLAESKKLKDEANKLIKTHLTNALNKYHKSVEAVLRNVPKFTLNKEDFSLNWKSGIPEEERKEAAEHLATVFSNCSLICIQKKWPLKALYYAKFSLWCNELFVKAKLRLAKALIDILHLQEAEEVLEEVKDHKDLEALKNEITDMFKEITRLRQEFSSNQKISNFFSNKLSLDEGRTFFGPVKLAHVEGKGRGIIALRDIEVGEIVMIDKGILFGTNQVREFSYPVIYPVETVCPPEKIPDFIEDLVIKVNEKDELIPLVTNLFPFGRDGIQKDVAPHVKEYLDLDFINTVFFMSGNKGLKLKNLGELEIQQIVQKQQFNSFPNMENKAIFPYMSYFNHSCNPNCAYYFNKDNALLLSSKPIKKGEEVFISYVSLDDDYIKRSKILLEKGVVCKDVPASEAQITGIKCPKCSTDIISLDGKEVSCPQGCWKCDYAQYQKILFEANAEAQEVFFDVERKMDVAFGKIEKVSTYNIARAYTLGAQAKRALENGDEKNCRKYLKELSEFFNHNSSATLEIILNSVLFVGLVQYKREVSPEDLEPLTHRGLPLEVTKGLWKYLHTLVRDGVLKLGGVR